MKNGVVYPVNEISDEERLIHLNYNLKRSNDPIRDDNSKGKIEEFIQNELEHGLLLPIPKSKVAEIPGAESFPIHIVKQVTINEQG